MLLACVSLVRGTCRLVGVGIDGERMCWWMAAFVRPKLHLDINTLAHRFRLDK